MALSPLQINQYENAAISRANAQLGHFDATATSFVGFTTHLLHDVFEILLDSTIEQLEAYADLVANVSGSLAAYEVRMVGNDAAFKERAIQYINDVITPSFADPNSIGAVVVEGPPETFTPASFAFDPSKIEAARTAFTGVIVTDPPPGGTFDDLLGTGNTMTMANMVALVIAKLKQDVKASYDKLATILKIGMQKLVVTDGEVKTSLTWHVDATDTDEIASQNIDQSFDQRAVNWNVSRVATRSTSLAGQLFGMTLGRARGAVTTAGAGGSRTRTELKVQVVNEKKTAVTHLNVDITESVTVRFKSETFPPFDPATVPAPVPAPE